MHKIKQNAFYVLNYFSFSKDDNTWIDEQQETENFYQNFDHAITLFKNNLFLLNRRIFVVI